MINVDARLNLNYVFKREGSRTVADRFRGEDYKQMSFPSGTVERQHKIGLEFFWEPLRGPQVNVSCAGIFTRSQHETIHSIELSVTTSFFAGMTRPGGKHENNQKGVH